MATAHMRPFVMALGRQVQPSQSSATEACAGVAGRLAPAQPGGH
ncbi:hypothetical protein BIWAKO_05825 [Bosea sp. BIWAKO-01]|nr:hypothetical protein BIWAKO_05825 [Bosea sp. BIWAKO-01]